MQSPNARWNKHSKPTSVGTCILLISRNTEKLVNDFIENTRSDTTCETVYTIINIMDATLNTMDATLNIMDATLNTMDATLNTMDATLNIMDATLNIMDATLNTMDATLNTMDNRIICERKHRSHNIEINATRKSLINLHKLNEAITTISTHSASCGYLVNLIDEVKRNGLASTLLARCTACHTNFFQFNTC